MKIESSDSECKILYAFYFCFYAYMYQLKNTCFYLQKKTFFSVYDPIQ